MPVLVEPALPIGILRDREQPQLKADELVLRPWRTDDAPIVREAFECPDIQQWHVLRLDSSEEAHDWTNQWPARWAAEEAISWAVVDGAGKPLGQVGLRGISLAQASAGVSYWTLPAARGQGVAARAVRAMQAWVFGEVGFHRLELHHSTRNEASCRVAAKTGYALEGMSRQAIQHADGWHDWHIHGRLRADA
jgi:RimJ/RimL family protein N-acetyltransferase